MIKNEKTEINSKDRYNYNINNNDILIKKNNNIFNILNKKNLIQKSQLNNLCIYNRNKYINDLYNINRIKNIRRKNNYTDNQKENEKFKVSNKIKLNPIKKTLLNVC
jgi:phosphopentomutase